jgi:hypothetical protein
VRQGSLDRICRSRRESRNNACAIAPEPQGARHSVVAAFVGGKSHSLLGRHRHRFFMGKRICRVGRGGLDIVLGHMRIGLEQLFGGGAFAAE